MLIILTLFLICMAVQAVFFLRISAAFSAYSVPDETLSRPVSVVVCARNEAQNLQRLLPLLLRQAYTAFEVILVDDRSSDETRQVCADFNDPRLRYIRIDELPNGYNGKKNALEQGINAAKHDLILLTDADCMPASDYWISGMSNGFVKGKDFVLGFSMYERYPGFLNLLIRFETLWTAIHYLGLALLKSPYMGVGRNLGYRKKVFASGQGFRGISHITGGDDDLFVNRHAHAENCSVIMGRDFITWSVPKKTWSAFFIQKRRHLSVGHHYRPATRIILGVLSLSHIFGYIFMGILLFHPVFWVYAATGLVIRTLLLLYTFKKACQKLEIPFSTGKILPMDLMYAIYYPLMGISASIRKKIRWN